MSETKNQVYLPKDLLIDSLKFADEDPIGIEDFIAELRELARMQGSVDEMISQLPPETKARMQKEAGELLANFPPVDIDDISEEDKELFRNFPSPAFEDNSVSKEQESLPKKVVIESLELTTGDSVGVEDLIEKLGELARTKTPSPVNS